MIQRSLDKVTLLLPTINEIVGMKAILPTLDRTQIDQILVLDGGSTDGTVDYAKSNGCEVLQQTGKGVRSAYIQAYPHIKGEIIITFSIDGNSDPQRLYPLINKMREGYDMVIVSRYKDWAKSEDDTFLTSFGNWAFTTMMNILFNFGSAWRFTDAMVMFRAFRKSLIPKVGLLEPRHPLWENHIGRYVSWEPQLSIRTVRKKVKIDEIPGNEPPRIDGITRIRHFRTAASCLYAILEDWIFWR